MYPNWTENTVLVNGNAIHYTRTGDGSKPPLVLAHGYSDNGMCWQRLAHDLEADFDIILPDARGHGGSGRVFRGDEISLAADLHGLIATLGLSKPIVGGHSMGAATASEMESVFPGTARALLLEDPPWWDENPHDHSGLDPYTEWLKTVKNLSDEAIDAKCRADSPAWAEVEIPEWVRSKRQFDTNFVYADFGPDRAWQEIVPALACPTLLLIGEPARGGIVTPELAQKIAGLNSAIRIGPIVNAGHNIRRDNYADTLSTVKDILKGLR